MSLTSRVADTTHAPVAATSDAERAALATYERLIRAHYPPQLAAALAAAEHASGKDLARVVRGAIGKARRHLDNEKAPPQHPYREALAMIDGFLRRYEV